MKKKKKWKIQIAHSLGVYSQFAFYAEGQVLVSALETAAKVSVAPAHVHDEAMDSKKNRVIV